MQGIDISSYQIVEDWNAVKNSGVEFVIFRAGWGKTNIDSSFKKHIEGALSVGLKVGVYWFLYAKNEADVLKNAEKCDKVIAPYKDKIKMRVWCDWEYDSDKYFAGLDKKTRTAWVVKFCEALKDKGYEVGVYANRDYLLNYFDDLSAYPLWYAFYSSKKDRDCLIWQSSSKGKIAGIGGNVDLDTSYEAEVKEPALKTEPKEEKTSVSITYTVRRGDTLSSIAKSHFTSVSAIAKLNKIKDVNKISVGQVLEMPVVSSGNTYEVTAKVLNVRLNATTRSQIKKTLKKGQIIEIERKEGMWGKLKGETGWVFMSYLKKK